MSSKTSTFHAAPSGGSAVAAEGCEGASSGASASGTGALRLRMRLMLAVGARQRRLTAGVHVAPTYLPVAQRRGHGGGQTGGAVRAPPSSKPGSTGSR